MQNQLPTQTNKPDYTLRAGRFKISKWSNEKEVKGQQVHYSSYQLVKSWTTDGKNWSEAKTTLFPEEVAALLALLADLQRRELVSEQQ